MFHKDINSTHQGDYTILNYRRDKVYDCIDAVAPYRSVIMKKDKVLSVSPQKSFDYYTFLNRYSEYSIEELIEGPMVTCFYDKDIDTWQLATRTELNNSSTKELFNILFDKENWSKLNKSHAYSFVMQDKSLSLITNKRALYLVDVFDGFERVETKLTLKNVEIPEQYKAPFQEVIREKCHINSNHLCEGIMLKHKNERATFMNSSFEYYRYIFKNPALEKLFDFFCLKKKAFIAKHNAFYYQNIKRNYHNMTYHIYLTYRNIYIHKNDHLSNYDGLMVKVLKDLHHDYIHILMPLKKYVDKKHTIKKINEYSNHFKFQLVTNIRAFYALLSKLRI